MQTICAHCYKLLNPRLQRTKCILCTNCEQNWAAGKAPIRARKLPTWESSQLLPAQRNLQGL